MSKSYLWFVPSLKWDSASQTEIMKQCVPQNNLFQQITMLQYGVHWLILFLIKSHHTLHGHFLNIAKLYPFFLLPYLNSDVFIAFHLEHMSMEILIHDLREINLFLRERNNRLCFLKNDPSILIHVISRFLSIYFSYINIVWCNSFPKAWGEAKAKLPSNYEILQFRLWAPLKAVLILIKVFSHKSSSHILYKVHYVNNFYSLYYYHHYYHCIVNIVILHYMQTWSLHINKRIYCLFVCLFVCVIPDSEYTDNSKPISLESFFLEKTVFGLCGSFSLLRHYVWILLAKLLL